MLAEPRAAGAAVAEVAEAVRPVAAGEPAPAFEVQTVDGEAYRFAPASLERPVILILFRGGWCPYCNLHLSELRHVIPQICALGVARPTGASRCQPTILRIRGLANSASISSRE
jgi:hypothetical protein